MCKLQECYLCACRIDETVDGGMCELDFIAGRSSVLLAKELMALAGKAVRMQREHDILMLKFELQ